MSSISSRSRILGPLGRRAFAGVPTASSRELGAGKWQAGPAAAVIYTGVKNLTAGAVFQNPISFAGDSGRAKVNELIIAPTLTYSLSKGWFAGLADYNWTFDWETAAKRRFRWAFKSARS